MTIQIPEWLLWSVGIIAALVMLFFGVLGLIAFRSLRGPFWR